MTLDDVGYTNEIGALAEQHNTEGFQLARVLSTQKERYTLLSDNGEYEAEITGKLRYFAQSTNDFPIVGDWVLLSHVEQGFALIQQVLPRYSTIKRKTVDKNGEAQLIAANIDVALIVQAADRDFNLNRIERYLAICADSQIESFVVITKIDLFDDEHNQNIFDRISERMPNTRVFFISNETGIGISELKKYVEKGKTYCLLGSSGVGKSTIINTFFEEKILETGPISNMTAKGKHTTTSRELVVVQGGAIFIDNPGMREVGMTDSPLGLEKAFSEITMLASLCKYSDCTHTCEKGCAVLNAVENETLNRESYENFLTMEKEKNFFSATAAERHRKDKDFGKMLKNFQRDKKMNKF